MSVEEGCAAAREVGLQILATAKAALGDLDRVTRGESARYGQPYPDFERQPQVINGCWISSSRSSETRAGTQDLRLGSWPYLGRSRSRSNAPWRCSRRPLRWSIHDGGKARSHSDIQVTKNQVPVTREGLERLRSELKELKEVRRRPSSPRWLRHGHTAICENAGYDAAKHDQAMTEKRIADLDALLRQAVIIDEDAVNVGDEFASARPS